MKSNFSRRIIIVFLISLCLLSLTLYSCKNNEEDKIFIAPEQAEEQLTNYYIAPEIIVDTTEYSLENIPSAVKGESYKLFSAKATDVYGNELTVKTTVYLHYYSENKSLIPIDDNPFIPTSIGTYTICYYAVDSLNNEKLLTVDIECEEMETISITLNEKVLTGTVGHSQKVATYNLSNCNGNGKVEILAVSMETGKEYLIKDNSFIPEYTGEYVIKYLYSDYTSKGQESYVINVVEDKTPKFMGDANLPEFFIVDAEYILPELPSKAYINNNVYDLTPTIEVKYLESGRTEKLASNTFVPTEDGDVVITYIANLFGNTNKKEFSAKCVDVDFLSYIKLDKYFYGENVSAEVNADNISLNTVKNNSSTKFINPILSKEVVVDFAVDVEKNNFNCFNVYLYNNNEQSEKLKFSYKKDGSLYKFIVNDDEYAYVTNSFEELKTCSFVYNNDTRVATLGDSAPITISNSCDGSEFNGFTSDLITIEFEFVGVNGYSSVLIYKIGNHVITSEPLDVRHPQIIFENYQGGDQEVGNLITIPRIYVGDVLDPQSIVEYYVCDPAGEYVFDVDGVCLDKATDYTTDHSFVVNQIGEYVVYIRVKDSSGNSKSYSYIINVKDNVAPTIVLYNGQSSYKLGDTVTICKAVATDNITNELLIEVVIVDSDYVSTVLSNGASFNPTKKGVYTVYYTVQDESQNVAIKSYSFIVE